MTDDDICISSQLIESACLNVNIVAVIYGQSLSEAHEWRFLATCPTDQFADRLSKVARCVRLDRLKKHGRGPKKPRQKEPYDPKQLHVATYKPLQGSDTP